jgi:hypothetical protein
MSYKSKNKTMTRWTKSEPISKNKTVKNNAKVCDLGINGTMKPCCDKFKSGYDCHLKPSLLDHTKRLTRSDTLKMTQEHDNYKDIEEKLLGSSGLSPLKYEISRKIELKGLYAVKKERDLLKKSIKMREDWLKKWYIAPSKKVDCFTCDANARNHNARILILNQGLDNYNESILKQEKKTSVSSNTRSQITSTQRPKMNLTRKKNIYKVDHVARRQILASMLAKKKDSQDRRKKSSDKKRGHKKTYKKRRS